MICIIYLRFTNFITSTICFNVCPQSAPTAWHHTVVRLRVLTTRMPTTVVPTAPGLLTPLMETRSTFPLWHLTLRATPHVNMITLRFVTFHHDSCFLCSGFFPVKHHCSEFSVSSTGVNCFSFEALVLRVFILKHWSLGLLLWSTDVRGFPVGFPMSLMSVHSTLLEKARFFVRMIQKNLKVDCQQEKLRMQNEVRIQYFFKRCNKTICKLSAGLTDSYST